MIEWEDFPPNPSTKRGLMNESLRNASLNWITKNMKELLLTRRGSCNGYVGP